MEQTRGKSIDDLELINWADASRQCGGDERDDVFLIELLTCYYEEGIPRLRKLLEAALAYRGGATDFGRPGEPAKPVEVVLKEEAHAMKGSAANIRLWRVAKVSRQRTWAGAS
jgi:HPt (histidine-containing phosphotransfer) domain-containing protein